MKSYSPLLYSGETIPRVLCTILGTTFPEEYGQVGTGSKEGDQDDTGIWCTLWGQAEGIWNVQKAFQTFWSRLRRDMAFKYIKGCQGGNGQKGIIENTASKIRTRNSEFKLQSPRICLSLRKNFLTVRVLTVI